MGRSLLFGAVMCAILLVAATTRSDVASSDAAVDDTVSLPEPITGTAVQPAPSSEPPPKDPFEPFDTGPPESIWPYESLTPEESTWSTRTAAQDARTRDLYSDRSRAISGVVTRPDPAAGT